MSGTVTSGNERIAPLLERDRELEVIEQAVASAAEGRGSLLLVEGPAGIGKTRLLAETAELGNGAGFLVRQARGGEMERDMPFGIARQLFEPLIERASEEQRGAWLSGSARQALAALGRADAETSRHGTDAFAPINGLYWLVANLSDAQPALLVADDAHWGDADSLRFIAFLARRVADLPVCAVLGARTGEVPEPAELKVLRLESNLVRPQPLSASSVHELITRLIGRAPSAEFSTACTTATAGNPFLVVEIVRELGSGGSKLDRAATESIAKLAPDNVTRSVLFRLGRFGEEAIALARAIAMLGRAPQLRHAAQLADIAEDRAASICDRLRDAEILAPELPLDFVHPLVRQAIYREQSEAQRVASHRRAAEVLSSTGAAAVDVAAHLLASAPNGDQWVVERLRAAAAEAINDRAYDSAATYLGRALQEPPDDPFPIIFSLGLALMESEPFRAPQMLADAAQGTRDPDLRLEALRYLATAHLYTGNLVEAANACDHALEAAGEGDRELTLALEAQSYFLHIGGVGFDATSSARIEAVAAGLKGETIGERLACQALAVQRFAACSPIDEIVALSLPFFEPPWEIRGIHSPVPFAAIKALAWGGRWTEARAELERWLENAHEDGNPSWLSAGNSFVSEVDRFSGKLTDAEAEARTALEIAESLGRFSTVGWSALMNLAATLLARGDLDGFTQLMGDFDLSAGPFEIPVNPWPLEIRAHLHAAQGDLEAAVDDFLALGAALEGRGWLNPTYPPWRQEATEILAALGRTTEAEELTGVAEERAHAIGAPYVMGSVMRARALLQPRKESIDTLQRSVAALEMSGASHEVARSLIELGAALRRAGERAAAREPLHRALELASSSGANGLEKKARDELSAAGARPRRLARTGVASLTASELTTARLAAAGLSNREIAERLFVTIRTVETHLTHVYEKLSIGGRRHLAAALAGRGVAAP